MDVGRINQRGCGQYRPVTIEYQRTRPRRPPDPHQVSDNAAGQCQDRQSRHNTDRRNPPGTGRTAEPLMQFARAKRLAKWGVERGRFASHPDGVDPIAKLGDDD